jgi:hypothetical protein
MIQLEFSPADIERLHYKPFIILTRGCNSERRRSI